MMFNIRAGIKHFSHHFQAQVHECVSSRDNISQSHEASLDGLPAGQTDNPDKNTTRPYGAPETHATKVTMSQKQTDETEGGVPPVLGQFHDDVSVCGEDDEGHSQHGAAKHTVAFKLVKAEQAKPSSSITPAVT